MKYRVKFRLVQVDGLFTMPDEGNMVRVVDEITFDGGWLVLKWEVPGVQARQVLAYPAANIAEGVEILGVPDDYVERYEPTSDEDRAIVEHFKDKRGGPVEVLPQPLELTAAWLDRAVVEARAQVEQYTTADENREGIEILAEVLRRLLPEMRIDEPGTLYAVGTSMWTTLGDTGVEILHAEGHNIGIRWRRTNKWTIPAGGPVHAALIELVATVAQGSTRPGRDKMTTVTELWPELAGALDAVIAALGDRD